MNLDNSDVSLLLASRQGEKGYEAQHPDMVPADRLRDDTGIHPAHPPDALRTADTGRI